jgi:hypothetical protein
MKDQIFNGLFHILVLEIDFGVSVDTNTGHKVNARLSDKVLHIHHPPFVNIETALLYLQKEGIDKIHPPFLYLGYAPCIPLIAAAYD